MKEFSVVSHNFFVEIRQERIVIRITLHLT